MTVKVSKPAINVREELADLKKPTGIAGEAMLRAETPQEQFNLIGAGRRRININGDMRVAQRATSASVSDGANEGYQTLDRWRILFSSGAGGAATMSQDTTVPNTSFANSLKLDVTTADTSVDVNHSITLQYRFEAQDIANSGWDYTNGDSNLSVSFWARSVKAGTYCVFFFTQDGTSRGLVQEYTLAANTWKYVTLTFKGDSGISFDDDNGNGLTVGWTLVAGSNRHENVTAGTWITTATGNNQGRYSTSNQVNFFDSTSNDFYLTGVQLEVGKVATPFEHRSYGEELALCQRYYQQYGFETGGPFRINGAGAGSGTMLTGFMYQYQMRSAPAINYYGTGTDGGNFNVYVHNTVTAQAAPTASVIGTRSVRWNFSGNGSYPNSAYWIDVGSGTNQLAFTLDAEL